MCVYLEVFWPVPLLQLFLEVQHHQTTNQNKTMQTWEAKSYLFAQVFEQNLLDPLNWLAGARLPQYSHFNTEEEKEHLRLKILIMYTDSWHRA